MDVDYSHSALFYVTGWRDSDVIKLCNVARSACWAHRLTEPFSEAKKRIAKELKLTKPIDKLAFDSEILSDQDSPETVGMEADNFTKLFGKKVRPRTVMPLMTSTRCDGISPVVTYAVLPHPEDSSPCEKRCP
ncbi:hypothetical protein GCK32_012676 [Trichostrongylus colubriformis]|uniref:Uncharacterized protein n=1 Tax=Trichostrongylus colubriformis TaxID=6319 RepID=A0AAN8FNC4_TRICO